MAKPSRERVRKWREKKAKKGGRSLSTWLEPETVRMMDYLLNHYGETAAPLIARAIASLYEATCPGRDAGASQAGPKSELCGGEPELSAGEKRAAFAEPVPLGEAAETVAETAAEETGEAPEAPQLDPLLGEIKAKLAEGAPVRNIQRTLLVQWIKSMQANNVSFQVMAELLNAAGIPTLSGKGEWEQGMIPTILLLSSF
ncbi:hypothetical protein [Desulfoferrobacter suflitae]|uniref:hypothetical protein n=1 Tax=Desulfoferrobacter suflitae TaxID=2865782 RepID=UPI002164EA42|nr:hypothetical protein [Desulfoferrobacter suflitae]MCK8601891.1 hypothetical protein [Desulfoferrobacter suflitae]